MHFTMDICVASRHCVLLLVLLLVSCPVLTSAEDSLASVVTSQDDAGTCSFVLTIPKEPCKCDCIKEFQQLTMDYERRLGDVERMLLQVLDALPQENDYEMPQSSASHPFVPSMDSVPVFFPDEVVKPPFPEREYVTGTPEPWKSDDQDIAKPTTKPTSMTVKPYIAEDEADGEDMPPINIHMTADAEEIPLQMDGMSGYVVVPEEHVNHDLPTIAVPLPGDPIIEVEAPPAAVMPDSANMNLPALKGESITSADIDELHKALKTPKVANRARPASLPVDAGAEEAEEETPPRRMPPGFVVGMEKAAGSVGEVNRPQWKKLEEFLESAKPNGTSKRERPAGIEREPDCDRDGCGCLVSKGRTQSGIYLVPNVPESGKRGVLVELYCDLETSGGGWTVIQRRQNGSANFYRNWNHYAHGFGYLDSSFWIGNRMLHALTHRFKYELRIEFTDWDGKTGFAEYDRFYIGPEEGNFQLTVGKFRDGNRGNAFSYHNGSMFSTYDRDNDKSSGECAVLRQAGFWFKNCNKVNPNGRWVPFADATGLNGAVITWGTWSRHLYTYSMKDFRMMIRPIESSDFA